MFHAVIGLIAVIGDLIVAAPPIAPPADAWTERRPWPTCAR